MGRIHIATTCRAAGRGTHRYVIESEHALRTHVEQLSSYDEPLDIPIMSFLESPRTGFG